MSKVDVLTESGISALRNGKPREALNHFTDALKHHPEDAELLSLKGLALTTLNLLEEAYPCLKRAVQLEPGVVGFRINYAECLLRLGQYQELELEVHTILRSQPNNPAAWHLLSQAGLRQGNWQFMEETAEKWCSADSRNPMAWRTLATAQMERGLVRKAESSFREFMKLVDVGPGELSVYANICLQCYEIDSAQSALNKSEALDPYHLDTLVTQSLVSTYLGQLAKAEEYCRRALAVNPLFVPAFKQLNHLLGGAFSNKEKVTMEELLQNQDLPSAERIDLCFCLGFASEKEDDMDSALSYFRQANQHYLEDCNRLIEPYNGAEAENRLSQICRLYAGMKSDKVQVKADLSPIFIVGMPRSGTTLVEAILSSHSAVIAAGERPLLPQLNDMVLEHAVQNDFHLPGELLLNKWIDIYLGDLPESGNEDFFTDKNPLNFESIGLINQFFPGAPIIHLQRRPMDTCLSIFKHKFSKFWRFAHRLEDIAHFYGLYVRLMAYWEQEYPGRIYHLNYSELVLDMPGQVSSLLRHCHLPWQAQCEDFSSSNQAIATLSSAQVRTREERPFEQARKYGDLLKPLELALRGAGVNPETGALI